MTHHDDPVDNEAQEISSSMVGWRGPKPHAGVVGDPRRTPAYESRKQAQLKPCLAAGSREYAEIEYAALPVNYRILPIWLCSNDFQYYDDCR